MEDKKEKMKSIQFMVTENEHQYITDSAKQMKHSVRKYTKLKVLDKQAGVEQLSRQILQLMPTFYNLVGEIKEEYTRQKLMEIGGQICQHLK